MYPRSEVPSEVSLTPEPAVPTACPDLRWLFSPPGPLTEIAKLEILEEYVKRKAQERLGPVQQGGLDATQVLYRPEPSHADVRTTSLTDRHYWYMDRSNRMKGNERGNPLDRLKNAAIRLWVRDFKAPLRAQINARVTELQERSAQGENLQHLNGTNSKKQETSFFSEQRDDSFLRLQEYPEPSQPLLFERTQEFAEHSSGHAQETSPFTPEIPTTDLPPLRTLKSITVSAGNPLTFGNNKLTFEFTSEQKDLQTSSSLAEASGARPFHEYASFSGSGKMATTAVERPRDVAMSTEFQGEKEKQQQTFEHYLHGLERQWYTLTPQEKEFLRQVYQKGKGIQDRVRSVSKQTDEGEIRTAVEEIYTYRKTDEQIRAEYEEEMSMLLAEDDPWFPPRDREGIYKLEGNEDLFYSNLKYKVKREDGKDNDYGHRNNIDVAEGIFYVFDVKKDPGPPFFSTIQAYVKLEAEKKLRAEGRLETGETIMIRQICWMNTENETFVETARLAMAGKTKLELDTGSPGFTMLLGTPPGTSSSYAAERWGQSVSRIILENPLFVEGKRFCMLAKTTYVLTPEGTE